MPMAQRADAATSPVRERDAEEEAHRKEKSVLQAKLTKLAIQIGYVGKDLFFFCFLFAVRNILLLKSIRNSQKAASSKAIF